MLRDGIVVDFIVGEENATFATTFNRKEIEESYEFDESNKYYISKLTREEIIKYWTQKSKSIYGVWGFGAVFRKQYGWP